MDVTIEAHLSAAMTLWTLTLATILTLAFVHLVVGLVRSWRPRRRW